MADNDKIKKLWKRMADELSEKDPHDDWPYKGIVMVEPWCLEVHAYPEAFEEHETQLDFVREKAIRPEDFDETSLPPELLAIVKGEEDEEWYPNHVTAMVSGATLEEAIEKMRLKLRLLDYGYILMDGPFYREEFLDENNGGWLLDDDDDDDDEIVIHLDDDDFKDDDEDAEDGDGRDD